MPVRQDRTAGLHCTSRPTTNRRVLSSTHTLHTTPSIFLYFSLPVFGLSRCFIGLEVVCCVRVALHSGVVLARRRRRRRGSSSRPGQCKVKAGSSSQQRFSPPADLNCQTQTGQRAAQPCLISSHLYHANKHQPPFTAQEMA